MEYKSLVFWRIHYERGTILIPLWRKNRTRAYVIPVFPGLDSGLKAAGRSHICTQINTRLRCQISLLKWTTSGNRTAENRKFVWWKHKDSIAVTEATLKYQPHLEHIFNNYTASSLEREQAFLTFCFRRYTPVFLKKCELFILHRCN